MYDLSMSVREAMAVLVIFIFDIHLPDLLEHFLYSPGSEGIAILDDKSKDIAAEKKKRDLEKKLKE